MHLKFTFKILVLLPVLFLSFVSVSAQEAFITTWKTNNPGISDSTSIRIPVSTSQEYAYDVDWNNDGVFDEFGINGSVTHDFGTPGIYTIRIRGAFPHIFFNNEGDEEKLIDIAQWGAIEWRSMYSAFHGCKNLNISAIDAPDLSQVTTFQQIFAGCTSFNSPIGHWDVSQVESFYFAFMNCEAFNQPLNEWNTSSATNMQRMFINCISFNQAIDDWDVSQVASFSAMFQNCKAFDQALSSWDMSSAIHISLMFGGAESFNQPIGNWQLDNMTHMHAMFSGAKAFNQDIGDWDVSRVTTMKSVFKGAEAFNQDLNDWDVSQVTDLGWTFANAKNFNQNISDWDVSQVTSMSYTFFHAEAFNQDIGDWDVGQVMRMGHALDGAKVFNQDIGGWDVSNVNYFGAMFAAATNFDQDIGDWDVSQATEMWGMFHGVTLSTENYDRLLMGWSMLELQDSVQFHAGNSIYCEGWESRASILSNHSWEITDGGSDQTPPVPVCKDITVELENSAKTVTAEMLDNGSSAHCTGVLFHTPKTNFTCEDIGTTAHTLTVTDMLGNEADCISNITVIDGSIQFTCPESQQVLVNSEDCQAVVNWDELYGNCTTSVSTTHWSGAVFPLGTTTVKYTAVDAELDTMHCSFTVTVSSDLSIEIDSLQHPSCYGDSDGAIAITAQGGGEQYIYDWDVDGTGDKDDPEDLQNLSSGTYQLLITDAFGCTSVEMITLVQPDLLILDSEISENANGQLIDLSVSGGTPEYQFDWDNDGTGDFDDPEDLEISESGIYTVVVKDANGCTTTHRNEAIINHVKLLFSNQDFELNPNPNQGIFTLELANVNTSSKIDIYNAQGKRVYSQDINQQKTEIALKQFPSGTYFLRLNSQHGAIVRPFIISGLNK